MKSICFIITDLSIGGAEVMLLRLLENLNLQEYSPFVVSLTNKGEIGLEIERLGIEVISLNITSFSSVFVKSIKLYRILKARKPMIVHTWMYHSDFIGGIVSKLAGVKSIIWSLHHSDLSIKESKLSTILIMRACAVLSKSIPDVVVSCSNKGAEVHIEAGYSERKMTVIGNGFDTRKFVPSVVQRRSLRSELKIPDKELLVGFIGRYTPEKNHVGFIQAMPKILCEVKSVMFLFVGEGLDSKNSQITKELRRLGVNEQRVILAGSRTDMPRVMASLDVLVSYSLSEAFPVVLGEAMLCGVPCVAADVGDCSLIIGDCGFVVAPRDRHGLTDRVSELLNNSKLRSELSKSARERIISQYDIKRVVKQYERCYSSCVGAR